MDSRCIADRFVRNGARHMRNFTSWAMAAAVGAIALSGVCIGSAAGADVPGPPQGQLQPPPAEYDRGYVEEPYIYQQPPAVYYGYPPPPIVALPEPYYRRPHYRPVYGGPAYGARPYAPYVARGFGPYDRGYRHW